MVAEGSVGRHRHRCSEFKGEVGTSSRGASQKNWAGMQVGVLAPVSNCGGDSTARSMELPVGKGAGVRVCLCNCSSRGQVDGSMHDGGGHARSLWHATRNLVAAWQSAPSWEPVLNRRHRLQAWQRDY